MRGQHPTHRATAPVSYSTPIPAAAGRDRSVPEVAEARQGADALGALAFGITSTFWHPSFRAQSPDPGPGKPCPTAPRGLPALPNRTPRHPLPTIPEPTSPSIEPFHAPNG